MVINKADTNPRVNASQEVADFIGELENVELAETRIGYRLAYRRLVAEGLAVNEMAAKNKDAIDEMAKLYKEVFQNG